MIVRRKRPTFTSTLRRRPWATMATSTIPPHDLESFKTHLKRSENVLALCGAGLSAASGLPTFRGAGGLWRSHDAVSLATPQSFGKTPGLVWQFYSYRRHMALQALPNPAHYALAELAKRKDGFRCLTQNVDGELMSLIPSNAGLIKVSRSESASWTSSGFTTFAARFPF